MCKVTAIITTHNRGYLVTNAINSVLNQTFKDFELLIIDDASKDNTEEVVKNFADDRIRYIKILPSNSKGGNYARNLGINEAKGEFIAFLDDDDEWMLDKLEKQLEVFKKDNKVGLVYAGLWNIQVDEKIVNRVIPLKRGNLSKDILMFNPIGPLSLVMAMKEILIKIELFDIEMPAMQDYDMYVRLCQICDVDFVKEPLVKYHRYSTIDSIGKKLEKYEKAIILINEKYKNLIQALSIKERKQRDIHIYNTFCGLALLNNDFEKLKKYALKGLSIQFSIKIFTKLCFGFMGNYKSNKIGRNLYKLASNVNRLFFK